VAAVTALCTCVLASPHAGAAPRRTGIHWTLALHPFTLHRGDRTMTVSIVVSEADMRDEGNWVRDQGLEVIVSSTGHTLDARYRQADSYGIILTRKDRAYAFIHRTDLSAAHVRDHSAAKGASYTADLRFEPTSAAHHACAGHTSSRRGRVTGTFRLRTANSTVGDITLHSASAWLRHTDGSCGPLSTPGAVASGQQLRPCMDSGTGLDGYGKTLGHPSLVATRPDNSPTATIRVTFPETTWYGDHRLTAVVPSSDVEVPADLTSATITGEADGWITGAAHEPSDQSPGMGAGPAQCRGNAVDAAGPVEDLTGNLVIDMGLAGRVKISTAGVTAQAFREAS
jgi:hypothetical protein